MRRSCFAQVSGSPDTVICLGCLAVGGLMRDLTDAGIADVQQSVRTVWPKLARLRQALERTSSFLDRIERIGIIAPEKARTFELLGPMARR